jgi:hypothetical protein
MIPFCPRHAPKQKLTNSIRFPFTENCSICMEKLPAIGPGLGRYVNHASIPAYSQSVAGTFFITWGCSLLLYISSTLTLLNHIFNSEFSRFFPFFFYFPFLLLRFSLFSLSVC